MSISAYDIKNRLTEYIDLDAKLFQNMSLRLCRNNQSYTRYTIWHNGKIIESSTMKASASFDVHTDQINGSFRTNFDLERDRIRPRFRLNPDAVININDEDFCETIKKSMSKQITDIREMHKRKKNANNWDVVIGSTEPLVKDGVIYFNITKSDFMLDVDDTQSYDFMSSIKKIVRHIIEERIEKEIDSFASLINSSKNDGWKIVNRLMVEQEVARCLNLLNIDKYNLG